MAAGHAAREAVNTVTGPLRGLTRQSQPAVHRLLYEQAYVRGKAAPLSDENADLRARLGKGCGGSPS